MNSKNLAKFLKKAGALALAAALMSGIPAPAVQAQTKTALAAQVESKQTDVPDIGDEMVTVTLKNIEGKNASDVAAIKKILEQQVALGVEVSRVKAAFDSVFNLTDLDNRAYVWNEKGRLVAIGDPVWGCGWNNFKGKVSFKPFTELKSVICFRGSVTQIDVSKNRKLEFLVCSGNKLATLDVSSNTKLGWLDCRNNKLTTLTIGKLAKLDTLDCRNNKLTTLDISGCKELKLGSIKVDKNVEIKRK